MSNAAIKFDISAVTGSDAFSVWVPFMDGCRVKIRYIPRDELRDIAKKATTVTFDNRTHQKSEEVDRVKWDQELGKRAVEDWEGFGEGEVPFPCIQENIKTFMTKWSVFAKFVGDLCVDLETLVAAQKESERKNSQTGSLPAVITQE